jgi:hypothetical protein
MEGNEKNHPVNERRDLQLSKLLRETLHACACVCVCACLYMHKDNNKHMSRVSTVSGDTHA